MGLMDIGPFDDVIRGIWPHSASDSENDDEHSSSKPRLFQPFAHRSSHGRGLLHVPAFVSGFLRKAGVRRMHVALMVCGRTTRGGWAGQGLSTNQIAKEPFFCQNRGVHNTNTSEVCWHNYRTEDFCNGHFGETAALI